jgi:hypothetical protein
MNRTDVPRTVTGYNQAPTEPESGSRGGGVKMLMHLLPGLRELRAPLVSGYLWLISAWLAFGHMGWLPSERPEGTGEVARLWDLGGTLGKAVVLAVITFIAYLIGSFLEINPDGRVAGFLTPLALADHRPWYGGAATAEIGYGQVLLSELGYKYSTMERDSTNGTQEKFRYSPVTGLRVSRSITDQALRDLIDLFKRRKVVPEADDFYKLASNAADKRASEIPMSNSSGLLQVSNNIIIYHMAHESIAVSIIDEMQQLASRLLVKNQDLYGKYDRQMAEASVRMNISIPLTVLLLTVVWLSTLPLWSRLVLTLLSLAFGFMLLRQGFLRAMSARDVIVQALAIGEVESRYVPSEETARSEEPSRPKEPPQDQIGDRPAAQ